LIGGNLKIFGWQALRICLQPFSLKITKKVTFKIEELVTNASRLPFPDSLVKELQVFGLASYMLGPTLRYRCSAFLASAFSG